MSFFDLLGDRDCLFSQDFVSLMYNNKYTEMFLLTKSSGKKQKLRVLLGYGIHVETISISIRFVGQTHR